ncbi:MAG: response regulator, partial [Chloroflexi bacterium]|nr:response regulator [Chloroflexota bacterium]
GLALLRRIKECSPRTECIVVTGYASQESAIEAVNLGAYGYLQKPYEIEQLLLLLRRAVEKRAAEQALARRSALMEGINQVLLKALACESEQDVALVCLEVAQQLTGSAFGFVSKVNQRGRIDTLAVSDPGWQNCTMPRSEAASSLQDMEIGGYWGRAIRLGQSQIVNHPQHDPDWQELPPGHPPIHCFLGVPLKALGQTVGLIALANREGGYTLENQQDIETLAVAMVAALQRKEGEQQKRTLEAQLRKEGEQQKRTLEAQLRKAQRMEGMGLLAGGVAHEFNNLLTIMLGNAQLALLQAAPGQALYENLLAVERAGQRAATLTRQLLAFSRHQELQRCSLDLNGVVRDFVKMVQRLIGEQIELQINLADLPPVHADAAAVEQVLMNLVLNARDAMPGGGVLSIATTLVSVDEVYTQANPWARTGEHVCLTVADTGQGMDEATLKRLFEPFFTTKQRGEGTGLGLSVVYGIVRQHDGWIDVHSEPGRGTRFSIFLPVHNSPQADGTPAITDNDLPRGVETILLAEDEESVRTLAQRVLEGLGYTVLVARDGQEAVDTFAANQERVDLLILDGVMPRLSGQKAHQAIQAL